MSKSKSIRVTPRRRRLIVGALMCMFFLNSCEVVRTITTTSECMRNEDKNVIITTKTIETYSGKKQI